ncbi:unnamed protein product [Trichogramma brassicae]|uniref:Uncharacterized protein n=1 Tax=Trichogramma brassicae TaxID=86971 RepID=A0A6H5IJZ7_9HYME|nr:unnamed protein product [Trichogramma brassicae]
MSFVRHRQATKLCDRSTSKFFQTSDDELAMTNLYLQSAKKFTFSPFRSKKILFQSRKILPDIEESPSPRGGLIEENNRAGPNQEIAPQETTNNASSLNRRALSRKTDFPKNKAKSRKTRAANRPPQEPTALWQAVRARIEAARAAHREAAGLLRESFAEFDRFVEQHGRNANDEVPAFARLIATKRAMDAAGTPSTRTASTTAHRRARGGARKAGSGRLPAGHPSSARESYSSVCGWPPWNVDGSGLTLTRRYHRRRGQETAGSAAYQACFAAESARTGPIIPEETLKRHQRRNDATTQQE